MFANRWPRKLSLACLLLAAATAWGGGQIASAAEPLEVRPAVMTGDADPAVETVAWRYRTYRPVYASPYYAGYAAPYYYGVYGSYYRPYNYGYSGYYYPYYGWGGYAPYGGYYYGHYGYYRPYWGYQPFYGYYW